MRFKLRNLNLSKQLVLLVYLCMAGIYITFSIFWIIYLNSSAQEDFLASGQDMCLRGNQLIEKECSYLRGISAYLSVSSYTKDMFKQNQAGSAGDERRVAAELANLKYVVTLIFYNLDGEPIDFMSIDQSTQPVRQDPDGDNPFARMRRGENAYEWQFIEQGSTALLARNNSPKLFLWRPVVDSTTARQLGVMAIAVDTRRFIGITSSARNDLYSSLILLDRDTGKVASNHSAYRLDEEMCAELVQLSNDRTNGNAIVQYEGKPHYVFFERSFSSSLAIFYLTSRNFFAQNVGIYGAYFVIVLLGLTLALVPLLGYATRRLTLPMRQLTEYVVNFSRGDLKSRFDYDSENEIGILARAFNELVQKNQEMMERAVNLEIREQEAVLTALQAQINPHFLYNLLNMIYWRALRSGNEDIADIAYAMGQLFRRMLRRDGGMIPLCEELEICRYYLLLQKERFRNHIEYVIEVEKDVEKAEVPKLFLQPLVENAVVHGAENYDHTVHIRVSAVRDGDWLRVQVYNDGLVIPEQVLRELPDGIGALPSHRPGNRYALSNISDRLRLLYGDDHEFSFRSSEKEGTIVTVAFPLHLPDGAQKE